jgi:rhodanese-related sulfurtransferase
MSKHLSGGKQALLIFIMALAAGLTMNAVSSKGIPLFTNYTEKMKADNTDSLKNAIQNTNDFKNNPYDTTQKNKPLSYNNNPNLTKEGFIKPQKIKLDLAKLLFERNALMIDARKPEEFAKGHIKGAINISYEDYHFKDKDKLPDRLKGLNKDGIIIAYCNGGDCDMSIDLAYDIAKLGFNAVNIYLGGFKEWEAAGLPVEK